MRYLVLALLVGCASSRNSVTTEAFGDRPWLLDYRVEAKHGASHLRVFESGERILVEETCCPRRQSLPELRPLSPDEIGTYREMLRMALRDGTRERRIELGELHSGKLSVRNREGELRVLKELAPAQAPLGILRTNDSDATTLLLDEVERDLSWVLPR